MQYSLSYLENLNKVFVCEAAEDLRPFSRSPRSKFQNHLVFMNFHLELCWFLVSMEFQKPTSANTKRAGGIFSMITFFKLVGPTDQNALYLFNFHVKINSDQGWSHYVAVAMWYQWQYMIL